MKRIDDKIDELIARQDKIFQEMASSREQQNNTVNTFKQDASELIFKVNEVSEKIVDFEKNKRNNLILFGVPNDPHETPTSLDGKVWQLSKYIESMCKLILFLFPSRFKKYSATCCCSRRSSSSRR